MTTRIAPSSRPIFIAGVAAHSLNAVAEYIESASDCKRLIEPFTSFYYPASPGFPYYFHLRPDNADPKYLRRVATVLAPHGGKRRVLIQEWRANLWLGWLSKQFPQTRVVLVVRHPCAVASTRILLDTPTRTKVFAWRVPRIQDGLERFADLINHSTDLFDRHVIDWCLQHHVPLRQLAGQDHHVLFYERLVTPETRDHTVRGLLEYVGGCSSAADQPRLMRERYAVMDGGRKHITRAQEQRAADLLREFGLGDLYDEHGRPSEAAACRT
jgi:hypothetical protein